MGLRRFLGGSARQPKGVRAVVLTGGRRVNAVGESNYQATLEQIVGGKRERGADDSVQAFLVREPKNRHDPNAVKVLVNGETVGYLCREDAIAYQPALRRIERERAVAMCEARIVGGWRGPGGDEGHFGIWLDLAEPAKCLPYKD